MNAQNWKKLEERAKELECVYAVDEVLQNRSLTLSEAMVSLAQIIPTGFSEPSAARVRITLWQDFFETQGFSESEVRCSVPILLEGSTVGELAVCYVSALLRQDCEILHHEKKMLKTIALRISQLALGMQGNITLLLNILRQIDPDMLLRIGEKLQVYLQRTVGKEAEDLFSEFDQQEELAYGESNAPLQVRSGFNAEEFAQKLVAGSTVYLPQDTVFKLINEWIQEQRVLAFVKTVDRRDSTLSDILDAVRKYTGIMPDRPGTDVQYSQTETWLLSELTHRFLSDDESLINLVLDNLDISDFEPMMKHIISSDAGTGNIGGKGAGLFIASQILRRAAQRDPLLRDIRVPGTWYLATDQIVDFLHYNNLEYLNSYKYNSITYLRMTYAGVVQKIKKAALPPQTVNMLRIVLDDLQDTPLIVRSSSLLEDKYSGSFSGKYKSLFLSNEGTRQERLGALIDAVLEVYSSMYNPDSIEYRKERGLLNFTEQMGVLIQEVVGKKIGNRYMPLMAGVAFSNNLLRWSPRIQPEDGLVRVVMGLGTRAVDRVNDDYPIMFAAGQPQLLINQSPSDVRYYSPKQIDLIDPEKGGFTTVQAEDFLKESGKDIPGLHQYVSVYANDFIEEKNRFLLNPSRDNMIITFHQILTSTDLPQKIKRMLDVLSKKLLYPVDIEFAYDGEHLYLLQCRPQGTGMMHKPAEIPQNISPDETLFTAGKFVSDGILENISHIVYVDGDAYRGLSSREELLAVGATVGMLNELLPRRRYILMGPGRWGSRGDIQLGVRVTYSDISGTAALIEIAKEQHSYMPELSFGTHFFQDLVEADISYIPLYPDQQDAVFNERYLTTSHNCLGELLPQYAWLSDTIKVIDVTAESRQVLEIRMNAEQESAIAFFTEPKDAVEGSERLRSVKAQWHIETKHEHWEWRNYMAQQIAADLDLQALGVKGIYLFGSTDTGESGIGSDIDLLLHVDADEAQREKLKTWLDGWSRALARINYLQTGYDTDKLLDVHLVTDADIKAGNSYAIKINSLRDPVTPLRLRDA